ncbi:MAG: adenylosuccinate lyase [Bdellovibrionales bacterium]|nr:adenylosuccinate lyase [Bdellovibrionales bacterium]
MIERYTRPPMGQLWSQQARFQCLMEVELAVAKAQAEMGIIPKEAYPDMEKKASFQIERILEIEKETKHDIIAFVSNLAENVGENGRYFHYGMTSSDALDTALSLQVQKAGPVLMQSLHSLLNALKLQAQEYSDTLCSGRTHGMHAEPTTFGLKLAGFYAEFVRHHKRLQKALEQMAVGKISGAVGTYSFLKPDLEKKVCDILGLKPETVATQVVPRDRHAELMTALALLGGGIERLSVELRHLQRTEVSEAYEGFTPGQKGSSAMPHKKNPISSENLTGCARLLRSYALAALENMALWHERDISHSSAERVIFPDAFILSHYACERMARVIENLEVDKERMLSNMDLSQGQLFSSHLLLHMVDQGLSREEAYRKVQAVSHGLQPGEHLKEALLKANETKDFFNQQSVDEIFSGKRHLSVVQQVIDKALGDQP